MNPFNTKGPLHPQKWHNEFKDVHGPAVGPNEIVRAVVYIPFTVGKVEDTSTLIHSESIFYIVRTPTELIARNLKSHQHPGAQEDHTSISEIARYPLEDELAFKQELGDRAMSIGQEMANGTIPLFAIDKTRHPLAVNNANLDTTADFIKYLEQDENDDEGMKETSGRVLQLLGLKTARTTAIATAKEKLTTQKTLTNAEKMVMTYEIQKASEGKTPEELKIEEEALIAKYGRENIESLAKKINYNGELINKNHA